MAQQLLAILALLPLALLSPTVRAQGNGPGVGGARAAALGNASVALAGADVWAVNNNAAALGDLRRPTAGGYAENRYFSAALNVAALALALPLGVPGGAAETGAAGPLDAGVAPAGAAPSAAAVAAALPRYGTVAFEARRFGGSLYNETRVGVGYGYRLGQISVGGRVDALQISIEGLGSRRVLLASLGGQAELVPGRLTFGASLYNLNQARVASYQNERVPTVLRAGLAYRPSRQVLLLVETEKDVERDAGFRAGLEYCPVPLLAARLGLATGSEQVSAGLGLRLGDFGLDYAAAYQQALGFSQHLSVAKTWGAR